MFKWQKMIEEDKGKTFAILFCVFHESKETHKLFSKKVTNTKSLAKR